MTADKPKSDNSPSEFSCLGYLPAAFLLCIYLYISLVSAGSMLLVRIAVPMVMWLDIAETNSL